MMRKPLTAMGLLAALAAATFLVPASRGGDGPETSGKDPQIGQEFRVPYRLTLTNHYLVRVRINGQGPFNFLVDTGAPALFIGTEAAEKVGLKPPEGNDFWSEIDRFDIEGGATLHDIKGRVDDVFQLEGMNALGLPGATIDGILGYTVLARFRMEFDPTQDRMTWTRLDFEPKEPFVPKLADDRRAPAEMQMMEMLGPLMKLMSVFLGKQPEDILQPQGLLGLELQQEDDTLKVAAVLPGSPAAEAGIEPGDLLVEIHDQEVEKLADAHEAIAQVRPGDRVTLKLRRDSETIERALTAAEGF